MWTVQPCLLSVKRPRGPVEACDDPRCLDGLSLVVIAAEA